MEHKEDKKRNKGGRPKDGATDKMTYRVVVKMTAADYFRLLTRAYEAGVSPSGYNVDSISAISRLTLSHSTP